MAELDPGAVAPLDAWDDGAWSEDWSDVESTTAGPQGTLLPKGESSTQSDTAAERALSEPDVFESPEQRAQLRFERLSTAFSVTLATVAQMYRDEDWRYLRKDDGSEYKSLVEVCQAAMGKSVAMARRYVQGARDLYLPLSEVMVEGTRLEITSSDIATLGQGGIASVVDEATNRLQGVQDPEESTQIVNDTLQSARDARDREREAAKATDEDGTQDGPDPREYYEPPEGDAYGPVGTYVDDEDEETVATAGGSSYFTAEDDDLISPMLTDAPLFRSDEALGTLPAETRDVVQAMLTLAQADVAGIAKSLSYDNRGIVVHTDEAQKTLARIRSMAETQPWVMQHLGHAEEA